MPHDAKGNELKVGDIVNMQFKIQQIHLTEDYCNLTMESVRPLYPGEHKTQLGAVNSKQVDKEE